MQRKKYKVLATVTSFQVTNHAYRHDNEEQEITGQDDEPVKEKGNKYQRMN